MTKKNPKISNVVLFYDRYLCQSRLWKIRFYFIASYYLYTQIKGNWIVVSCRTHDGATDIL